MCACDYVLHPRLRVHGRVAREGVRVGWMQASDCVPILIRRQDARNIFAVKRVREGLAKLQCVQALASSVQALCLP